MRIVQTDEIPLVRGLEHRGGTFHGRIVVEGKPGALDNFQVSYGQMGGDFNSPRHRHNFEQIRYQLEGVLDYGRDGKLTAGMVGYFPEAVYYGPQSQAPDINCKTIVLQFGGASGSGYLSQAEVKAGMEELRQQGEFKDGVFRRHPLPNPPPLAGEGREGAGKRNMDGYQAIWEHVNRRPMAYPAPRYPQPIFMDPANYDWVPVAGQPGVTEKLLGVFTERRSEAGFVRLAAGARFTARGKGVYHQGIDIEGIGQEGAPILAAAAGQVVLTESHPAYGNYVIIRHPNGSETKYAHLSKIRVRYGQFVDQGEVVGGMGHTGYTIGTDGNHLHFELWIDGVPVDPLRYLP